MLELDVFLKQMCCIEESTCDIFGTFRRPRNDLIPDELCSLAPLVTPMLDCLNRQTQQRIRFLLDSTTRLNKPWYSALTQKLRQNPN